MLMTAESEPSLILTPWVNFMEPGEDLPSFRRRMTLKSLMPDPVKKILSLWREICLVVIRKAPYGAFL